MAAPPDEWPGDETPREGRNFLTAEGMGELLRAHEERLLLRIGELLQCPGRGGEGAAPAREALSEPRYASEASVPKRAAMPASPRPAIARAGTKTLMSSGEHRQTFGAPSFIRSQAPPALKSIEVACAQELFQGERLSFSADHMSLNGCTNFDRSFRTSDRKATAGRCKALRLSHVHAALKEEDELAEAALGDPAESHGPATRTPLGLRRSEEGDPQREVGLGGQPSGGGRTHLVTPRACTMRQVQSFIRSRIDLSDEEAPEEDEAPEDSLHSEEDDSPGGDVLSPPEVQVRHPEVSMDPCAGRLQSIMPSPSVPLPSQTMPLSTSDLCTFGLAAGSPQGGQEERLSPASSTSCPPGSLASLHGAGEEGADRPGLSSSMPSRSGQRQASEGGSVDLPRQKSTAGTAAFAVVQRLKQCSQGFRGTGIDDVQNLRLARETDLIQELSSIESASTSPVPNCEELPQGTVSHSTLDTRSLHTEIKVASPMLMRLWGVLAWHASCPKPQDGTQSAAGRRRLGCRISALYQHLVLALAVANVCVCARMVAMSEVWAEERPGSVCSCFQQLADLFLALGSMGGLAALRDLSVGGNLLGSTEAVLVSYARREGLVQPWCQVSAGQAAILLIGWLLAVCARAVGSAQVSSTGLRLPDHGSYVLTLVSFTFSSGLFTVLAYSLLHITSLLTMMVDSFCFRFVEEPYLEDGVRNWNILQAVLRRASGAVELGFLVIQTAVLVAVLIGITAVVLNEDEPWAHVWVLIAVLPLAMVGARLFFKASEVTEKCTRVPPLINSLHLGGAQVDPCRHYLVQYITYSAAGFYVKEVRLTAAMTIKLAYLSGMVAFGVLTKVASAG